MGFYFPFWCVSLKIHCLFDFLTKFTPWPSTGGVFFFLFCVVSRVWVCFCDNVYAVTGQCQFDLWHIPELHGLVSMKCLHHCFRWAFSGSIKLAALYRQIFSTQSLSLSNWALSSRLVRGLYSMSKSIAMKESKHMQMSLSVAEYSLARDLDHPSLYQHINSFS